MKAMLTEMGFQKKARTLLSTMLDTIYVTYCQRRWLDSALSQEFLDTVVKGNGLITLGNFSKLHC